MGGEGAYRQLCLSLIDRYMQTNKGIRPQNTAEVSRCRVIRKAAKIATLASTRLNPIMSKLMSLVKCVLL